MDWLNKTHVGDCRDLLRKMAIDGVRVQCVVTSPPYWGLRDYGVPGQFGLERTWVRHVARMREVFRCVREVLADDGTLWMNYGDSYASSGGPGWQGKNGQRADRRFTLTRNQVAFRGYRRTARNGLKPKDLVGMPWRVAFALQDDDWYLRSDIIWHKPNPMPESVTDRPTKAHEYLFLLAKSERYYYDAEAIAEGGSGRSAGKRNRRSVWTVPTQPFSGAHFATFPRTLIEPCILAGSRPGDTVLDPFMGSGTTAQVATDLGRNFIGCELNPDYVRLHDMRRTTQGMPL